MKITKALLPLIFIASISAIAQESSRPELESVLRNGRWSKNFTIAGFTGEDGGAPVVYDFARKRDGATIAAGRFQWSGKRKIGPLAVLRGNRWESATAGWDREAPAIGFSAVAVNDDDVLALSTHSGPFGGAPAEIWIESGGSVRVIGHLRGTVRSMVWFKGQLWAAGFFELSEGGARHLAVWDGSSWSTPAGGAPDQAVYRIQPSGDTLLFAGDFQTIGGIPAKHIAEWDGSVWKAYDLAAPISAGHVYTVGRNGRGELFAGGAITGGLARWTGSAWEPVTGGVWLGRMPGVVTDMLAHRGDLYITGCFSHVNGEAEGPSGVAARSVARWTGSRWETLDDETQGIGSSWFEWGVCGFEPNQFTVWDVRFQRLFSDGGRVLLGGMFPGVADAASQSIVQLRNDKWKEFGSTKDGLFGAADSLAAGGPGNKIHVLGTVTHAGKKAVKTSGVFRYEDDEAGWVSVGPALPQGLGCGNLAVDLAGSVHLACSTQPTPAGPGMSVVLRLDADRWTQMVVAGVEGNIWDIRSDAAGRIWVAGGTRTGDASGSGFVARLDGDRFTVVEKGFNSLVFRIAFAPSGAGASPGDPIAAGAFTQIGSGSFPRIARLKSGRWEAVGSTLQTAVLAVAWGEGGVYVSTEKTDNPNVPHLLLGRWDGAQWLELGTPENGLPAPFERTVHSIRELFAEGKHVVAAGSVWPETGGRNVFVYDGDRIVALHGGADAIGITSIALANDGLWFGGSIAEVGSGEGATPSIGVARFGIGPR